MSEQQQLHKWKGVNRTNPCTICGKSNWCGIAQNGHFVICRRIDNGQGQKRSDTNGSDYWLYPLNGHPLSSGSLPSNKIATPEPERAPPDILDIVYRKILSLINLSDVHKNSLLKRGFTEEQVLALECRTWTFDGRHELAESLKETLGIETCMKIPGFYRKKVQKQEWPCLAGPEGLIFAIRNHLGQIVALKIRSDHDGENKYSYLSSTAHGGPGPGAQVHVPLFQGPVGATVRVTEGEFKSEIATNRTGMLTLSLPGVTNFRSAIPILKALNAKTVRLAFDQDSRTNQNVARALENAASAFRAEGFAIEYETWDSNYNGIDEALIAGAKIEIIGQVPQVSDVSLGWEDAVSLSEPKLPLFPIGALPSVLAKFVKELSDFTETPVDLAAMLILGVISTCVTRVYIVEVRPGYFEPINIWACIFLGVGNRKTGVLTECTVPLKEWQQQRLEQLDPKRKEALSRRKSEEAVIQSKRLKMAKEDSESERARLIQEIVELESKLTEIPSSLQIWTSEFTPEKLGIQMAENNERMSLLSDEGGIFDLLGGRYSGGVPNLDLILKSHAGSSDRLDRVGRASVVLNNPSLTMAMAAQPSVLGDLSNTSSFKSRGLTARILAVCPQSLVGYRTLEGEPVSNSTRRDYSTLVQSLLTSAY